MSASDVQELAAALQRLAAEGRFEETRRCLEAYGQAVEKALLELPKGDARIRQLEGEWRQTIEVTRRRVLAGRAHAAARLARLPRWRGAYAETATPRPTWQCLA
jgi:hypothetical protein